MADRRTIKWKVVVVVEEEDDDDYDSKEDEDSEDDDDDDDDDDEGKSWAHSFERWWKRQSKKFKNH